MRLIGSDGKQIGVIPLEEALKQAREKELDLVEIAPNAKPPVAKLIDYKKFRYEENKKEQESKKNARNSEQKEIRLSPFMGEHDLDTRIKKGREILEDGDKIKAVVKFSGRQLSRKQFGFEILKSFVAGVGDIGKIEREPRMEGKQLTVYLSPK